MKVDEEELGLLYRRAGQGDVDAQSDLVVIAMDMPSDGVCTEEEATCGAEILARIAATHGRADDLFRLAGILLLRSDFVAEKGEKERAEVFVGEAICILGSLAKKGDADAAKYLVGVLGQRADEGDEDAAVGLNELARVVSADVLQAAKRYARPPEAPSQDPTKEGS